MSNTILISLSHYLPGWRSGGPLQTIANLVERLGDEFAFRILTADRDLGDKSPYPDIRPGAWYPLGKTHVCYLSPEMQRLEKFAQLLRETPHDALYLNSFFDPHFTTLPLLARSLGFAPCRPAIIAPRGEFSAGALNLKSIKKRVFLDMARMLGVHDNLTWQASTELEAGDIRRQMGVKAQHVTIAPNLLRPLSKPHQHPNRRDSGAPLRVVFLSRISPMKNLHFALRVLAQVRTPLVFSIYGPKENTTYWQRCEQAIAILPPHIRVEYCGAVNPTNVLDVLNKQDLLFLPTLGENYGHVIAESFLAGTPVLISDCTPWCNLREKGLGEDLPLADPVPFKRYIEHVAEMSSESLHAMRCRVTEYAELISSDDAAVEANRKMFLLALGADRPDEPSPNL